uniref:Immune mapped protein 2 N-terminal domain-containing protein n=1 Tax=Toxoplasma gondii COUG TaxID=1074873 RepID=A0A2G8YAI8_TOXGO|nr:hypothetical protein TGCOUG_225940 [Toxoplasma gondii COUG]
MSGNNPSPGYSDSGCYYLCICCRPAPPGKRIDEEELVPDSTTTEEALKEVDEESFGEEAVEDGVEIEEGETAPSSAGAEVTREAAADGPTVRTRVVTKKRAKVHPKSAVKSQPKLFTGSAAGTPPPPPEACTGPLPEPAEPTAPLGMGVYLVYATENGGTMYMKWSNTPLSGPGVLAYIEPKKEVGAFKFQKKDGVQHICGGLEKDMQSSFVADRKKYYDGWATFLKQMDAADGTLVLLPATTLQPPPKVKVAVYSQKKIRILEPDTPLEKAGVELMAVVPDTFVKFDVPTMEVSEFVAFANNVGSLISFVPAKK